MPKEICPIPDRYGVASSKMLKKSGHKVSPTDMVKRNLCEEWRAHQLSEQQEPETKTGICHRCWEWWLISETLLHNPKSQSIVRANILLRGSEGIFFLLHKPSTNAKGDLPPQFNQVIAPFDAKVGGYPAQVENNWAKLGDSPCLNFLMTRANIYFAVLFDQRIILARNKYSYLSSINWHGPLINHHKTCKHSTHFNEIKQANIHICICKHSSHNLIKHLSSGHASNFGMIYMHQHKHKKKKQQWKLTLHKEISLFLSSLDANAQICKF